MPRIPLHDVHVSLGATMVDFAGWDMPVRYGSDVAEHKAVREAAGLFDISHMGEIDVRGDDAAAGLDFALVSGIARLGLGRAKYTMICTPEGGVIDDLIVYRRDWDHFVIVANASNVVAVSAELTTRLAGKAATVTDVTAQFALLAIQGPLAERIVTAMCVRGADDVAALANYTFCPAVLAGDIHVTVARTGYTGEDGFELFVAPEDAAAVWALALELGGPLGMIPCGLSARDTLRLEAGMPLYGHELGLEATPYEAGLGWVVQTGAARELTRPGIDGAVGLTGEAVKRGDFVGREALAAAKVRRAQWDAASGDAPASARVLVGLTGTVGRIARAGFDVQVGEAVVGVVTSGSPSPTLGVPIAMALVHPAHAAPGSELAVNVRGRLESMTVVPLPWYVRPSSSRGV